MNSYNKQRLKMKSLPIWLVALMLCLVACEEEALLGLRPQDDVAPKAPEVTEVKNLNGAAVIYYKVPTEADLLNVIASYEINGKMYEARATAYSDSLKVEGFGNAGEYQVQLLSEDKSKNKSEPVEVTIHPKEPPVQLVFKTLDVLAAFGGIKLTWENLTESNIIVGISYKDSIGDWVNIENVYSSAKEGKATIRGLDTTPRDFNVVVRDRWDNYSDSLQVNRTPMFEEELDKSKFREVTPLPNDAIALGGYPVRNIWDGNTVSGAYHTSTGGEADNIGKFITFDLGVVAKLSRYRMWERTEIDPWLYGHNNLKYWKVYGCTEITADMRESGSTEGWTLIEDAKCYKPSGEGPVTNEDKEYILNGDEHEIDIEAPVVRYIRIQFLENWSGGFEFQIGEMSFWGKVMD